MLYGLMFLNIAVALGLILTLWRSDIFRSSWQAHVVSLIVVLVLVASLWVVSSGAEAGSAIRLGHAARMLLVWFLYLPFVVFLLVVYVRAVLGLLGGADETVSASLRADHYMAAGDYHRAVRAYRRELTRDPENVELRLKLAEAFCELGDCERAVQTYHVAIPQLEHDHERQIQIVFRTAEVLADILGQHEEAAKELDYVRKRFAETPHAQVAQKRIVQYMAQAE